MKLLKLISQTTTIFNTLVLFSSLTDVAKADSPMKITTQNQVLITEKMIIAQSMTGGWSNLSNDDPEAKKAAEKSVSLQAEKTNESIEFLSLENAQRQVVAGMNYELKLKVSRNGQETMAMAIIWAKLDGSYQLTEWWWKG